VPAFGALYLLTVPDGPWGLVVAAQVLLMAAFIYSTVALKRLGIWVTPTSITERGFFRGSTFERAELGPLIFVSMFHGGWVDTMPQLFVCDPAGNQLIRMRGQFWEKSSMLAVAPILDIPLTELDSAVSAAELHAAYPGLLYWWERRPALAALTFAGALALAGVIVYGALLLAGVAGSR
jgi:hypothetical protein